MLLSSWFNYFKIDLLSDYTPLCGLTLTILIICARQTHATGHWVCRVPHNQHSSHLTFFKLFWKWHFLSEDFTDHFWLQPPSILLIYLPCFSLLYLIQFTYCVFYLLIVLIFFSFLTGKKYQDSKDYCFVNCYILNTQHNIKCPISINRVEYVIIDLINFRRGKKRLIKVRKQWQRGLWQVTI